MKCGPYELVVAPKGYPYKRYRDRYCYEHILVWWQAHGYIPDGCEVHHKDGNKRNNKLDNLECLTHAEHRASHATGELHVTLICPGCLQPFTRKKRQTHLGGKPGKYSCCCRACIGKVTRKPLARIVALNKVVREFRQVA